FLLEQAWKDLYGGVEAHADVGLSGEPEDRFGSAVIDPPSDFKDQRVGVADELGVLKDEGLVWVEADGCNFEDIVLGPFLCLFVGEIPLLLEEFLIISHLNVDIGVELVLEPPGEVEAENMADVHWTAGSSTSIEEESLTFVIVLKNKVQISMREEYLTVHKVCKVA